MNYISDVMSKPTWEKKHTHTQKEEKNANQGLKLNQASI